jgi:transaldolase
MSKNPLVELKRLGQSFWYDNISRELIQSGELKKMIDEDGLRGVTSNPSIFYKSIKGSTVYDEQLRSLMADDPADKELFYGLALRDIINAADLLIPVYEESGGSDGYVSMEVDPSYAYNVAETIREAEELHNRIDRKNLLIKVPATTEGLIAIRQLIAKGINVNVTLLFSVKRYEEVTHAYMQGLEERISNGEPIDFINSVASFFVSRVDTLTDKLLEETISDRDSSKDDREKAKSLMGKTAVANAKVAYQVYKSVFSHDRFMKLKEKGGNIQKILWASTSTKNPSYHDLLYVDELIGPGTINTMPQKTLESFRDHGKLERTIDRHVDEAYEVLDGLESLEINMDQITEDLEDEGVRLFKESFNALVSLMGEKRKEM